MEIIEDKKNDLLKRREIKFILESDSNPGIACCLKSVVDKFKVSEGTIVIRAVKNNFGTRKFVCEVFIYDSEKDRERFEPRKKVKKKAVKV